MTASPQASGAERRQGQSKEPPWRHAFDVFERPLAAASESWVQTDTFMDALAVGWRLQRRVTADVRRAAGFWLGLWDLPTGHDLRKVANQVASLERQVRDLASELEAPAAKVMTRQKHPLASGPSQRGD
jgi:hypothetical protein